MPDELIRFNILPRTVLIMEENNYNFINNFLRRHVATECDTRLMFKVGLTSIPVAKFPKPHRLRYWAINPADLRRKCNLFGE